jgi:hypothetical protein
LDKNISERSLFYFYVIETDTATSGLRWIFHKEEGAYIFLMKQGR